VPGLETAAYYHAASRDEVGGDFYDLFALARDRWGLFLGDVCGKGAAAAAVTSQIRYTLRAAAVYDPDPATVLGTLNGALLRDYDRNGGRFCTAAFGVLTPSGSGFELSLASGGHPPPLLLRADGTADFQPLGGGPFLGVIDDVVFTSTTIRLGAGDTFLLYTDGLTEARTDHGRDRYGEQALRAFAARIAPATAATAISAIAALLEGLGDGLDDDTAVLALGVPASDPATARE
jgi:sigma-B regulation protein RsbU (phosphoserine phosphatase)